MGITHKQRGKQVFAGGAQHGEGTGAANLKFLNFSLALSPAAVAANTTAEQTFAVTGLKVGDVVLTVVKPTAQAGLGICGARVSALDQIAITFNNNTAAGITPTAAETYKIVVARP